MSTTYRVTASALNFRSSPALTHRRNIITTLPNGHEVTRLAEAEPPMWKVAVRFRGADLEGYVSSRYLEPAADAAEPPVAGEIRAVHLRENRGDIRRDRDGGRAYPLGEPDRPGRMATTVADRCSELCAIVDWLDVERSARYRPISGTTYCNIYATDVCYLAGAYLPRVWWLPSALVALAQGEAVPVRYAETVHELSANMLFDWLDDFGARFGWRRVFDPEEVQAASNDGGVGVICAQRTDLNRSGHISVVAPEHDGHRAARSSAGTVSRPLQSQAGVTNHRYSDLRSAWWRGSQFRQFGFWVHA